MELVIALLATWEAVINGRHLLEILVHMLSSFTIVTVRAYMMFYC